MNEKVQRVAQSVADSALATLAARILQMIGIPLLLGAMGWSATAITGLQQRMAVVEAQRAAGRAEIIGRIEKLETNDLRDRELMQQLNARMAAVDAATQAILRELETQRNLILREQRVRP